MGVTRSGRVYTTPEIAGKGKAPAASGAAPEAPPIPQKKVTEEEAEAFMKVIKASEYKVLDIPNAFSLLLGRPWIYSAGAVPSSLHQRIKFIAEGRLITVKGEEDYAIYKETAVPSISIGDDENLPFHSFETISVIRDYGETLGQWKTKDAKLVPYHEYLEELVENFEKISFTYIPRIKNQFADALATLASMVSITKENLIEPLEIEIAKGPAHCDTIEATDEQP
ncbi:hypothetical protein CRG98_005779 [Punica granatum]|uniref:RNase H type-1 domain-containing protein n=1 Tax=Punica granatum TaxID=22663 RepID=A0A2I0KZ93_PUNGR|nr:hypothetical protein CRG98_005779 [Punica granatum]